jgi:hypothetical protein
MHGSDQRQGNAATTERHHNEQQGRAGGASALVQNIIPFDAVWLDW